MGPRPENHPELLRHLHCPSCGRRGLARHCRDEGNANCDLARCPDCRSFGTPDGRRWVQGPKAA